MVVVIVPTLPEQSPGQEGRRPQTLPRRRAIRRCCTGDPCRWPFHLWNIRQ